MMGYDDYEDLDEYEDDEQEEEVVEYEEVRQPTKEELDYLEIRRRLKESIRKQMKKGSGLSSSNSRERNKAASYDNYGSFFGPSQPVIAQRVIQESKSLFENHHLIGNIPKPQNQQKCKTISSSNGKSRPLQGSIRPPKVVNQQKLKVEALKNARDYSFLLSDNAELPVPSREPPPRIPSFTNSVARPANVLPKSRQPVHNGVSRQYQPSSGRQQPVSSRGNSNGRPIEAKGGSLSSKPPPTSVERKISSAKERSSVLPTKLHPSATKKIPVPKQIITGGHRKEQTELGRGKVPVRSTFPSAKPQVKLPARLPPSLSHDERFKKPVVKQQQPAKRRFKEDDDYEAPNISQMIRGMFNYNPNKYAIDDDDSDMEANYEDIMREERKSAKIAKKEDEEELLKIEEEERRERMRLQKKRKLI